MKFTCRKIIKAINDSKELNLKLRAFIDSDLEAALKCKKEIDALFDETVPGLKSIYKYEKQIEELPLLRGTYNAWLALGDLKTTLRLDPLTEYKKAENTAYEAVANLNDGNWSTNLNMTRVATHLIEKNYIKEAESIIDQMTDLEFAMYSDIINSLCEVGQYETAERFCSQITNQISKSMQELKIINHKFSNHVQFEIDKDWLCEKISSIDLDGSEKDYLMHGCRDVVRNAIKVLFSLEEIEEVVGFAGSLNQSIRQEAYLGCYDGTLERNNNLYKQYILDHIVDGNLRFSAILAAAEREAVRNNFLRFDIQIDRTDLTFSMIEKFAESMIKCEYFDGLETVIRKKPEIGSYAIAKIWTGAGLKCHSEEYLNRATESLKDSVEIKEHDGKPLAFYKIAEAKAKCGFDFANEVRLAKESFEEIKKEAENDCSYIKVDMLTADINCCIYSHQIKLSSG